MDRETFLKTFAAVGWTAIGVFAGMEIKERIDERKQDQIQTMQVKKAAVILPPKCQSCTYLGSCRGNCKIT